MMRWAWLVFVVSCAEPVEVPIYAYCLTDRNGERVLVAEYENGERSEVCPVCVEYGDGRAACE